MMTDAKAVKAAVRKDGCGGCCHERRRLGLARAERPRGRARTVATLRGARPPLDIARRPIQLRGPDASESGSRSGGGSGPRTHALEGYIDSDSGDSDSSTLPLPQAGPGVRAATVAAAAGCPLRTLRSATGRAAPPLCSSSRADTRKVGSAGPLCGP